MSKVNFNFTVEAEDAATIIEIMNNAQRQTVPKMEEESASASALSPAEWARTFEKHAANLKRLQTIVAESTTKV